MDPEVGDIKNGVVVIEDGRISEIRKEINKSADRKIEVKESNEISGF
jgi:5-methylthioadenosine/S-adenosylhomocysteine deaminase